MFISYPRARFLSACAGNKLNRGSVWGDDRLRGGGIGRRRGVSAGQVDAWAPSLRRLTPQVVAQAGRPHCHQTGPAAQEGVTTTSKRARAHSSSPAHPVVHWPARTFPDLQRQGQAHPVVHWPTRTVRGTRAPSARTTNSKGPASRLTPSSIPSTQCKSPDAFPFPDRSCKRFL